MSQADIESLVSTGALDLDKAFREAVWHFCGRIGWCSSYEVLMEESEAFGISAYRWRIDTDGNIPFAGRPLLDQGDVVLDWRSRIS